MKYRYNLKPTYFAFMARKWMIPIMLFLGISSAKAQYVSSTVLNGEFGISAGAAHYFGDLNTRAAFNRPKIAASLLFRKQFGNYIALRIQGTFAQLGYSDVYSKNQVQQIRNLSFNTNIFELALQGDFNFYRFIPGQKGYEFTPYVTLGAGFFSYDPYAYLGNEKFYLRALGTEGQNAGLTDRKPYGTMALSIPLGVGLKFCLTEKINFTFEIAHRFTGTDYLDDVSTTYAGSDVFPPLPNGDPSPAFLLQDRSYETSVVPIGIAGRQRGISTQRDQFITAQIGLTFNLTSYKCPTP